MIRTTASTLLCAAVGLVAGAEPIAGAGLVPGQAADDPEARRLPEDVFHRGLIKYQLLDLLDLQLQLAPPADPLSRQWLRCEIRRSAWRDEELESAQRRAALVEANDLLAEIIAANPADPRAIDWQIDLANSLLYEQAEPYYSSILYHGGTPGDRAELTRLMAAITSALTELSAYLDREYERLDDLSPGEYDRLERTGYVTKLEQSIPQAAYLQLWTDFYAAIALPAARPTRRQLLDEVAQRLSDDPFLLTQSHSVTHVQAQALLLAGMTARRRGETEEAVRRLQAASRVWTGIPDAAERTNLQWLPILAAVESIKARADLGDHERALKSLRALRTMLTDRRQMNFAYQLALAVLESRIILQSEGGLPAASDTLMNTALTARSVTPLVRLAEQQPGFRDEIYATLYARWDDSVAPAGLHPFQQCAVIAGHIRTATELRQQASDAATRDEREAQAIELLGNAADLARALVERPTALDDQLHCEALYNLGVAELHRGRRVESARRFRQVATQCHDFPRALPAARYAVDILADLVRDRSLTDRPVVTRLWRKTLQTLVEGFPGSPAAGYWRFFYAQALEEAGELGAAAGAYERIDADHPNYADARFRAARCLLLTLREQAQVKGNGRSSPVVQLGEARRAVDAFKDRVTGHAVDPVTANAMAAELDLLLAELYLSPGIQRPQRTIDLLADFDERYPQQRRLVGRVLRARIVAYENTDRLADAAQEVPRYIASDPANAGPTLQALFDATWAEIQELRRAGDDEAATAKARAALLFAEQTYRWARDRQPPLPPENMVILKLQWADASLSAGQTEAALDLFTACLAVLDRDPTAAPLLLLAARLGRAEALFDLERYDEALPVFNLVFNTAPTHARQRFTALLGDLRCRAALNEDPAVLLKIIAQHRVLHPELGGPDLRVKFDEFHNYLTRRAGRQ